MPAMRIVSTSLIVVGAIAALGAGVLIFKILPFGETTVDDSIAQQTEFLIRLQMTNGAGFVLVGGMLLVLMGILLRVDGGKR